MEQGVHSDGGRTKGGAPGGVGPPVFVRVLGFGLWAILLLMVLPLVVGVLPRGPTGPGPTVETPAMGPLLLNTALAAAAVGVLATAIGLCVAWMTRGVGTQWLALLVLPLALPAYLGYAGWSELRAPGTALGDWIGGLPGERAGEVSHAVSTGLAVLGLALWAWPLAAVVVGAQIRRLDPDLLVMLRAETRSPVGRAGMVARLLAPGIGMSMVMVALLVTGTAIPLHLANVPTLAINVWLMLDRSPPDQAWRAYVTAWPLWVVAAGAGWWLGGRAVAWAMGGRAAHGGAVSVRRQWPGKIAILVAVGVSAFTPFALLVGTVRDPNSFLRFWTLSGAGVRHGVVLAAIVGAIGMVTAAMVAACAGSGREVGRGGRPTAAAWFVRVMVTLGLAPGVLVGAGLVTGWNRIDSSGVITSSMAIEVLAHLARFGWVGACAGCVLARLEHPNLRDLRRIDGGDTLGGYARTGLVMNAPVLAATGLVIALLSFMEIEASVVVGPPGSENLARQILNYLHLARVEEMSAASAWIIGLGILCVLGVGCLAGMRAKLERGGTGST